MLTGVRAHSRRREIKIEKFSLGFESLPFRHHLPESSHYSSPSCHKALDRFLNLPCSKASPIGVRLAHDSNFISVVSPPAIIHGAALPVVSLQVTTRATFNSLF
jgi:hypothetical protein